MAHARPSRGAASEVLLSLELIQAISMFQRGIYVDMLPFVQLTNSFQTTLNLRASTVGRHHPYQPEFAHIHDIVSAWCAKVAWRTRIHKLVSCLPSTRQLLLSHAANSGNLRLLQSLMCSDALTPNTTRPSEDWNHPLVDLAALGGHLDVVDFLTTSAPPAYRGGTAAAMDVAAQQGHLDIVTYLYERRNEGCTKFALVGAAMHGHLNVVKYLLAHRPATNRNLAMALERAAAHGQLATVKYLHSVLGPTVRCSQNAMDDAATHGHLDVVEFLHLHRMDGCSTLAMNGAAGNSHLAVLRWLHANRTEGCSGAALRWACQSGHLDVVQFIRSCYPELFLGGPSGRLVDIAATLGHIEVLEWMYKTSTARCTPLAVNEAKLRGHLKVVQFLAPHGSDPLDAP